MGSKKSGGGDDTWTYLQNRNRVAYIENKLMVPEEKGEQERENWDIVFVTHTLLYLK